MNSLPNASPITIGFYVHHHGSGHIMTALTIARALNGFSICFLGSNLKPYSDLIPAEIACIHLPMDLPEEEDILLPEKPLSYLHYSPIGIAGIRERTAMLSKAFEQNYPMLLIVDVSIEVTLLARLCGIPAIVIKQHGRRDDLPHLLAYESAELLIAPFSKSMAPSFEADWVSKKTVYTGGFSKYSHRKNDAVNLEEEHTVGILIGQGGTSIDYEFILWLAASCKKYTFQVIGHISPIGLPEADNIKWHGKVVDPAGILSHCTVVIGNAGHNTVMEMADLNKRFICIPEERPFAEQQQKAEALAINGHAKVISPAELKLVNWPEELATAVQKEPYWMGVTNKDALQIIAATIKETAMRNFYSYQFTPKSF